MNSNTELTEKVMNGEMQGETVWICHYNRPDLDKKPLRNVPPTKCIVFSNEDLPKNKRIYYSECHYRPLGQSGEPQKKYISPVDNTGFRTRCGNKLFTFLSESECIASWNEQISEAEKRLREFWECKRLKIKGEIQSLNDMKLDESDLADWKRGCCGGGA